MTIKNLPVARILVLALILAALFVSVPEVAAVNLSEGQGPKVLGGVSGGYAVIEDGDDLIAVTANNTETNIVPVITEDIHVRSFFGSLPPYYGDSQNALTMPNTHFYFPPERRSLVRYRICAYAEDPANLEEIAGAMQFGTWILSNKADSLLSGAISLRVKEENWIDGYVSFFPAHATYMSSGWREFDEIPPNFGVISAGFSAWATRPVKGKFLMLLQVEFIRVSELATTV